jgi:DNA-directed RNA polymerase subunit omega
MARITIEDSLRVAKTRFGLVSLSSKRAHQLLKGSAPLVASKNREIVLALREIAAGKVVYANPEYLNGTKEDFKPIPDSSEFIGDEEYID